jgi:hypothetical protein
LPENNVLSRLDLSGNPAIGIAGLLALSVSVKMSTALTFLDIAIPVSCVCIEIFLFDLSPKPHADAKVLAE